MQTMKACAALVLFGVLGISGAHAADSSDPLPGQFYVAPSILFLGEDGENDLNSYIAPQIGVGEQITDRYALEFIYGGGDTELDGGGSSQDVDIRFFRLDALYSLGGEYWKPYVAGGAGRYRFDPDSANSNSSADTQLNLGLGLMRSITERLSLRGDARMYYQVDQEENTPGLSMGLRYVLAGPTGPRDADDDGVSDPTDQCPDSPAGSRVDMNGCPLDSDRDGVTDGDDECPRTPAGVRVDDQGCPLDSDRDGVLDRVDDCPDTPRGNEVDATGCTVEKKMVTRSIELRLEFDFDSADLRSSHHDDIERVADFMREYPDTSAQLEGHTDSIGTEAYNQALSERRAYSVRDYLIDEAAIDARRITAVGYGESRPAASNETEEGRQRNRRVEAVIETREMSVRPDRED